MAITDELLNYRQADEDGVMCLVSRQAVHESAETIESLYSVVWSVANYGSPIDESLRANAVAAVKKYNQEHAPTDT